MNLALREDYSIDSSDSPIITTVRFITLLVNWYNNILLPLILIVFILLLPPSIVHTFLSPVFSNIFNPYSVLNVRDGQSGPYKRKWQNYTFL
jgi:hypothetical protein